MDKNKSSRRGRNSLSDDEKRTHCVSVRLNKLELNWLDTHRQKNKKKYLRGEYLRMSSLGNLPRVIPEINKNVWLELGAIGNNLNQIAKKLNKGHRSQGALIEKFVVELNSLRNEVIGLKKELIKD